VVICISFIARDGEHFFMIFWPFEFLLLRKFCLVHLPISLLVLIDYLQDFFLQSVLVSFLGFFGIVYLRFVGVWM
jgi:hypothetical protein